MDLFSMHVGSTKSHDREKFNRRILPKGYNTHSSDMKYALQNERKYFSIRTLVILFVVNNLESNREVGVIKYPLESLGQQDVPLQQYPLKRS